MKMLQQIIGRKNTDPFFRCCLHAAIWIIYWAAGYYFNTISPNLFSATAFSWMEPLFTTINLVIFYYPFMYFTWPLLAARKKYLAFAVLFIIQVILFTILLEIQERALIDYCAECRQILSRIPKDMLGSFNQQLSSAILSSFLSFGTLYLLIGRLSPVIAIKIALDYAKERTASVELEKENLQLEFNFLRSQVNPHFLFNTLNNIHSLIVQDQKQQASATVARLSGFLRHSLYESRQDSMPLSREINLLQDYIELEKIRLNKTRVSMEAGTAGKAVVIPSLLFMPLVENAFKYNADNLPGESFINISLQQLDHSLQFCIENNYDPAKRQAGGGIGLKNLKKRLQHYYPNAHRLIINDTGNTYIVKIDIDHA